MSRRARLLTAVVTILAGGCLLQPARAEAQVYFTTYSGTNFTRPATVHIDQPALDRSLDFADVRFDGQPLKSPQYYGARIGKLFAGQRLGVEIEFLHQKAVARTERIVHVTGQADGLPVDISIPMNEIVQRYAMTHGLIFWLGNLVWRLPLGSAPARRASVVLRAGGGPVMPGVDTVVGRKSVQHYQYAGLGAAAAAGLDLHCWRLLSLTAEYKFTYARPTIDVDRGRGRTTTLAHHLAVGIGIGFAR
jgi:hypothetical protein